MDVDVGSGTWLLNRSASSACRVGLAGRAADAGALSVLSLVRLGFRRLYRAGDGNRTRVASLEV
jgi:hypothetical protein